MLDKAKAWHVESCFTRLTGMVNQFKDGEYRLKTLIFLSVLEHF